MTDHPHEANLQRQCAWGLGNLAPHVQHQTTITNLGGIGKLLDAMKWRSHDVEMLRECSRAIGILAHDFQVIRNRIDMHGGVEVVTQVMQDNMRAGNLQKSLVQALINLSLDPD